MLKNCLILILLLALVPLVSFTQTNKLTDCSDTSIYYCDLTNMLALRVHSQIRNNSMKITGNQSNQFIALVPNSPISIGSGFNYRGLALSLGFGVPHTSSNIYKFGKTSSFDVRGSFSGKKFGGSGYFQMYKGYYNSNPNDFVNWEKDYYPQISDLSTFSFGGLFYYIINHRKFSGKAAYSRTQIQKKSAGSLTVGIFLNYDEAESPNGFIPSEFPDSIGSNLNISGFRYFATGISLGYSYTWVISKSFFLNGEAIPGGGYKDIVVKNKDGESDVKRNAHAQLAIRAALGFESKHFYAGLTASTLIRTIETKDYTINLATGQLRLFIGKRFNVSKN